MTLIKDTLILEWILKKLGVSAWNWICMAQNKGKLWAPVNMVMNLQVP
jgi:hypothetical protein